MPTVQPRLFIKKPEQLSVLSTVYIPTLSGECQICTSLKQNIVNLVTADSSFFQCHFVSCMKVLIGRLSVLCVGPVCACVYFGPVCIITTEWKNWISPSGINKVCHLLVLHLPSSLPSIGVECSAAPVRSALPVPAQCLAGVCYCPLWGSAGWSCVCQHLLLHQRGGQVKCLSVGLLFRVTTHH